MKNKKWIIPAALIVIAALAVVLILNKSNGKTESVSTKDVSVKDIVIDSELEDISIVSLDTITGMYVEDGSNEVLSDIFTVTFRNESERTLQYAKLVLKIGDESYDFELTTVPEGACVRAMEMNRKAFAGADGDVTLEQENIAWFDEAPSMHSEALKITQNENSLVLENISGKTINAPIYVYYKNYTDDTYIGGITYRAGTNEPLGAGQSVALTAKHFDPEYSQLMFVTYGA